MRGTSFVRAGAIDAIVRIDVDGHEVTWVKGNRNEYRLGKERFSKVGIEVPQEVADVLRMGAVLVGEDTFDPNFHGQFDGPFLMSTSGPGIARILGEASGINIVYNATRVAGKELRQEQERQKVLEETVQRIRDQLTDYRDTVKQRDELDAMGRHVTEQKQKAERVRKAIALGLSLSKVDVRLSILEFTLERSETIAEAQERVKGLASGIDRIGTATKLLTNLRSVQVALDRNERRLAIRPIITEVSEKLAVLVRSGAEIRKASELLALTKACDSDILMKQSIVASYQSRVGSLTRQRKLLAARLDKCPLCGADLTEGLKV